MARSGATSRIWASAPLTARSGTEYFHARPASFAVMRAVIDNRGTAASKDVAVADGGPNDRITVTCNGVRAALTDTLVTSTENSRSAPVPNSASALHSENRSIGRSPLLAVIRTPAESRRKSAIIGGSSSRGCACRIPGVLLGCGWLRKACPIRSWSRPVAGRARPSSPVGCQTWARRIHFDPRQCGTARPWMARGIDVFTEMQPVRLGDRADRPFCAATSLRAFPPSQWHFGEYRAECDVPMSMGAAFYVESGGIGAGSLEFLWSFGSASGWRQIGGVPAGPPAQGSPALSRLVHR
jgi:hypothetical protein